MNKNRNVQQLTFTFFLLLYKSCKFVDRLQREKVWRNKMMRLYYKFEYVRLVVYTTFHAIPHTSLIRSDTQRTNAETWSFAKTRINDVFQQDHIKFLFDSQPPRGIGVGNSGIGYRIVAIENF